MRRCAPSVAVWLRLLSRVGNSLRYKWLWHVGESNPATREKFRIKNLVKNLSCRVRVRCHNVAREINYNLMNSCCGEARSRTPRR